MHTIHKLTSNAGMRHGLEGATTKYLLRQAFAGKSIFVTGHTGFKGSWLSLWLNSLGAKVTGYALSPPTQPSNFVVSDVREVLSGHHEADVRDLPTLQRTIEECQPEVILHLAAQSVVSQGYHTPRETFETNVMGTTNVLEAVRQLRLPCSIVVVTSDKCYENREQVWGYRETDAFGDHDPYGGSKGAAEIVVRTYCNSFFPTDRFAHHNVKLASARAGNVIGGGDWTPNALLVDVVRAINEGKSADIRSPDAFRPWQHVLQALSGYLTLAAKLVVTDDLSFCSGWNFGPLPGNEIPVRELVDEFLREWGSGSWVDVSSSHHPHEATILRLCVDKALWQLDWKTCWDVRETLQQTARWYRRYLDGVQSMQEFTLSQISMYEDALETLETPRDCAERTGLPLAGTGLHHS